ncbi:MAG: 4Fe-4S dicluster domain-containing protein, partial [Mailhella sp.]|nr:4Fe-4S dicluster domain-containing protein [Mailhella sp.]
VSVCTTKCRVFGDADDPRSEVSQLLASRKKVYVAARDCDTKPTLTYLDATSPVDWPEAVEAPTPIKLMNYTSKGVKWTAGAALLGVIGVFFKQLVLPSDREHGHHDDSQDKGGNA